MKFPSWTPSSLIKEIEKLREYLALARDLDEHERGMLSGFLGHPATSAEEHEKRDQEKIALLNRLSSYEYMREAWESLERCQPKNKYKWVDDKPGALWAVIDILVSRFPGELALSEPPKKKSKQLTALARKLHQLASDLESDLSAARFLPQLVQSYLGSQALRYRHDAGEKISVFDANYLHFVFLSDENEVPRDMSDEPFPYDWKKIPIVQRMAFWARLGQSLSVTELMRELANALERESQEASEILQPWRGHAELRPYLIRGLSRHFKEVYGSPLDDTVALIVSAILDIDPVLGRDDVRPYLT